MLALKLFLVPCLIAAISMAGRRWGAAVAGALAGFPVVTGPILLFVAIEQGGPFAAKAAVGAINAVLCNIAFGIAYSWVSCRKGWQASLAAGLVAYFCLVALFNLVQFSAIVASVVTIAGLLLAPRLYPAVTVDAPRAGQVKSDLMYRMVAGALLVITVTVFSDSLGPNLTGLLSVFPVMGSVLAVFSHRNVGQGFAVLLLRGMARGFISFTLFCLVLAYLSKTASIAQAFMAALAAAIVTQVVMMRQIRR